MPNSVDGLEPVVIAIVRPKHDVKRLQLGGSQVRNRNSQEASQIDTAVGSGSGIKALQTSQREQEKVVSLDHLFKIVHPSGEGLAHQLEQPFLYHFLEHEKSSSADRAHSVVATELYLFDQTSGEFVAYPNFFGEAKAAMVNSVVPNRQILP